MTLPQSRARELEALWLEAYVGKRGRLIWKRSPAAVARQRLDWVIRQDREACNEGWWMRRSWLSSNTGLHACFRGPKVSYLRKPLYRWMPRR